MTFRLNLTVCVIVTVLQQQPAKKKKIFFQVFSKVTVSSSFFDVSKLVCRVAIIPVRFTAVMSHSAFGSRL